MDDGTGATAIGLVVFGVFILCFFIWTWWEGRKREARQHEYEARPEEERRAIEEADRKRAVEFAAERAAQRFADDYGTLRPPMVCPHCQAVGTVYCKAVERKKGVSGAKATGALLTAGVSLLVVGLSRKETDTQAHCGRCESTWFF
jgi:cbb3-type cytochrome oxidase subunit 3